MENKKGKELLPMLNRRSLSQMIQDEQRSSDERVEKVVNSARDFLEKLQYRKKI